MFELPMAQHESTSESDARPAIQACLLRVSASKGLLRVFKHSLSDDEVARAGRFHRNEDRERFILGRGMLRKVCATRLGVAPSEIRLEYSDSGKPSLASQGVEMPLGFEFNVSHAADCVLLAWGYGSSVGVDIESLDHRMVSPVDDIARRVFSSAEMEVLGAASAAEKALTFFRLWSRKEAVLKAEGWGLGGPLQSFSVAVKINGASVWLDSVASPASGRLWVLTDLACPAGYAAALAIAPGASFQWIDPSDLLS